MKNLSNKIIVILGPTSSGKTAAAIKIAKKLDGEVISADSRQVYKFLNLASGKVTKKEMAGVPHHLIDVVHPKKVFTVADFQKRARAAIIDIQRRGKTAILCGGTGFYIDSIVNGYVLPEVPPNLALRKRLAKWTVEKLFKKLIAMDPVRARNIDAKNPVRLIRAIEIATVLGKVPALKKSDILNNADGDTGTNPLTNPRPDQFIQIGLDMPDEKLFKKTLTRLDQRLKAGMIAEIKRIHDKEKVSWKRLESLGLECRYVSLFLQNKITRAEMREQLFSEIKKYIKRQRAWFKRDKTIVWFDSSKKNSSTEILNRLGKFR